MIARPENDSSVSEERRAPKGLARRKSDTSTYIYWLYDDSGVFYCGKTIKAPERRLQQHRYDAVRRPTRPIAQRMLSGGSKVCVYVCEVVPPDHNWSERERHWIRIARSQFPGMLNISDGGGGLSGYVQSAETIEKRLAAYTPELRARLSFMFKGKPISAETRAKISKGNTGKTRSAKTRARISVAKTGRMMSESHRAKLSAIAKLRPPPSAETRAKISAANKRRPPPSAETRAKYSAWQIGRKHTIETRARMSEVAKLRRKVAQ